MEERPNASDLLTRQFYEWERRGRGWAVWDDPVDLEPPFRPFLGHFLPPQSVHDDGQVETLLSRFADSCRWVIGRKEERRAPPAIEEDEEPKLELVPRRCDLIELQTLLPANLDISREAFEQFLLSLSLCREPVTFEILGLPGQIGVQFAVHPAEAALVHQQLEAFFPEAVFLPHRGTLATAWKDSESAVVEFGLAKEFMLRLASGKLDPFVGIIGALAGLRTRELGLVQVMFRRARQPWAESIMRAVMDNHGDAFFANAKELLDEARKKVARPLYAAVFRIATQAQEFERAWDIARNLAGALHAFANPLGNELIPLRNDDYPFTSHVEDMLRRQSRRSGMLLNSDELIGFVHLPGPAVRSPKLLRETKKTKAPPEKFSRDDGVLLGRNFHQGRITDVRLGSNERVRHVHLIGAIGTGKSTLLLNLIRQDIENGEGLAVLDPHGDLVEDILGLIPPHRFEDVIWVDPSDEEYSVGFNILSAHSDLEKTLLASDLVAVFHRLSTSWGDQMGSVLQNAILAFLESSQGGTLADLRRFLVDPGYRAQFLKTVRDPDVVFYWKKTFPQLTGNRSIGPVLTRLETFLSPKSIRYMVSQPVNRLDFADMMDSGKIFLAKLSQGQIGRENAFLLGSLLVAKFQQTAMSRQRMAQDVRRGFWLYIDEFHDFITPSMAEILTGARKYRLGLTLAHQELRQLQREPEVASAVMANSFTRVVFRVGDDDARKLAEGFGYFEAKDLQNLGTGEAIARIERSDFDFNLAVPLMERPDPEEAAETRRGLSTASRKKYGTPRAEVQATLLHKIQLHEEEEDRRARKVERRAPPRPASPQDAEAKAAEVPKRPPEPSLAAPDQPTKPQAESPPPFVDTAKEQRQHQVIKDRIKALAETLDYTVTIEEFVVGSQGRADLVLRRGAQSIACEISDSNTVDYEVGNVQKCLRAGFKHVAVVCLNRKKAGRIQQAVAHAIPAEDASRVGYYLPDEFISKLYDWASDDPDGGQVEKGKPHKQKIRLDASGLTESERRQRENDMLKKLAAGMKGQKT